MKTFENFIKTSYLEFISESRYKTHGIETVKRNIENQLYATGALFDVDFNDVTDDFQITFYKLKNTTLEWLIQRCEVLGYFPSVFRIDGKDVLSEKTIDDFVVQIKKYKIPEKYHRIYIQFESWLDEKIEEIPKYLYHVFKTVNLDKIKRYGICPKAKNKISYHPDRIYFVLSIDDSKNIITQFKDIENDKDVKYSVAIVDTSLIPLKYNLLIRKDPNFNSGFYTNQNIPPSWITDYYHEK